MSRSLIRKDQINQSDASVMIGQYGSGYFVSQNKDETIDGQKAFLVRPTFNGSGILTYADTGNFNITYTALATGENIVYITGAQTISGVKKFASRPTLNSTGLATTGDLILRNGQDIVTYLNNTYFPYRPATISLNGYVLQELGTSITTVNFVGTTTANDAIVKNLKYKINGSQVGTTVEFPSSSFNSGIAQTITSTTTISVEAESILQGASSAISASSSIPFEAPHYYGAGALGLTPDLITGTLTRQVTAKYNPTFTFNTTNNYMYFAYPSSWTTVKSAILVGSINVDIVGDFNSTINLSFPLKNGTNHSYYIYRFKNISQGTSQITFNF